ncbi:MAG: hypothetical protein HRS57_01025, partial [Mycoplasmataceae bacterium]|nr:hypothetical protein [Mycoplasmataceae bacterium]
RPGQPPRPGQPQRPGQSTRPGQPPRPGQGPRPMSTAPTVRPKPSSGNQIQKVNGSKDAPNQPRLSKTEALASLVLSAANLDFFNRFTGDNLKEKYKVADIASHTNWLMNIVMGVSWLIAIALFAFSIMFPILFQDAFISSVSSGVSVNNGTYYVNNYNDINQFFYIGLPLLSGIWISLSAYTTFNGVRFNKGFMSARKLFFFRIIASLTSGLIFTPFIYGFTQNLELREETPRANARLAVVSISSLIFISSAIVYAFLVFLYVRMATPSILYISANNPEFFPATDSFNTTFNSTVYAVTATLMSLATSILIIVNFYMISIGTGYLHFIVNSSDVSENVDRLLLKSKKIEGNDGHLLGSGPNANGAKRIGTAPKAIGNPSARPNPNPRK